VLTAGGDCDSAAAAAADGAVGGDSAVGDAAAAVAAVAAVDGTAVESFAGAVVGEPVIVPAAGPSL
jgi:hypothetical protein